MFPLPKPHVFGKNEWKKRDLDSKKFMPKIHKLSFLEEHDQVPLYEKENELLDRDFGYKNIDELVHTFNNTKNYEESDELYDRIVKKLALLKKLVNTVSNIAEKERTNYVVKGVEFVLNYVAYYRDVSDSDSDFSSSNFSDIKGKGLKILTSNQMLSRLLISLAQLKAGNNSEKRKNEIRQILYSLYTSKKNWQNSSIKVWLTLFKNGNNLYEHWKL